jgi:hypothetical protein
MNRTRTSREDALLTKHPKQKVLANGLGHHICNVPPAQAQRFGVITFALQRANQPALVCVKLSIVIFYMRIFERGRFRVAAHCVNAYNIAWGISTWIVNLTVCTPVAFYYDHTIKGGSCRNQAVSGSVSGGLSLLGDLLVLGLPLPMIWGLKINWRKKASIAGIFLLGCLFVRPSLLPSLWPSLMPSLLPWLLLLLLPSLLPSTSPSPFSAFFSPN